MEHVFWCIGHQLILPDITKAEGSYLYDAQGRKYLDMESGIWCTPLGHCHPQINQAIASQSAKIIHTGYCYTNRIVAAAAAEILDILDLPLGKCVLLCSGSEAVEFGVQALRRITKKPLLLTLADSFLSSYGSAGNQSQDEWHLFDWRECATCPHSADCNPDCEYLSTMPFEKIGGFVFEPGSASGLVRFPPKSLIQNIVKLVKQHAGLIQINEITTGMGRTGKWFGFQHYDLHPDLVSIGKGLGNGYPVSAIAMSPPIIDHLNQISFHYHQSHQNDPLGCAVAKAVITVLKEQNLIEKCNQLGAYFLEQLFQLKARHPVIKAVRGRGLMMALEFQETVTHEFMENIYHQCIQRGFIIARRPGLNVFRIDPPLIIEPWQIDAFLENFEQTL